MCLVDNKHYSVCCLELDKALASSGGVTLPAEIQMHGAVYA